MYCKEIDFWGAESLGKLMVEGKLKKRQDKNHTRRVAMVHYSTARSIIFTVEKCKASLLSNENYETHPLQWLKPNSRCWGGCGATGTSYSLLVRAQNGSDHPGKVAVFSQD